MVTTDFEKALKDVEYIMVSVPAIGAERFFEAFLPHLKDGQTVVKWSANFSALAFASILRERGVRKEITLAESHTLPWGCRIVEPGTVQIMVWAVKMLLAAFPAQNTGRVIRDVQEMYPVVPAENVLASTLNNLNPIVHPVGTVMNAGWVDAAGKDFYFYRDGNTLSVSRCIKRGYEEVREVAEAIGVTILEYPEEDFWKKSAIMASKKIRLFGPERNLEGFKRNGTATDGQVVTLFPDNFGSLILRRMMREQGCDKRVVTGGWSSLPYGARLTKLGEVNEVYVLYRAVILRGDTLPSRDGHAFFAAMKELPIMDTVDPVPGDTVIEIGFSNVNPILHVPATVMNVGAIDNWGVIFGSKGEFFDIYKHGFSYNLAKIQYALYREEAAVAERMGVGIQTYEKKDFFSRTSILGKEFMGPDYAIPFEEVIPADEWMIYLPGERFTLESRYITEDIPVGCNIYYQLASRCGVKVPVIESVIRLASVISEKDYFDSTFTPTWREPRLLHVRSNSYAPAGCKTPQSILKPKAARISACSGPGSSMIR